MKLNNCSRLYCRITRIRAVGIGVGVSWRPVPSHGRHHADKRRPTSQVLQRYSVRGRRSALCFSGTTHFDLIGFRVLQSVTLANYEASIRTQGTLYQGRDGNELEWGSKLLNMLCTQ
jgi:hypothetical protein